MYIDNPTNKIKVNIINTGFSTPSKYDESTASL